MNNLQVHFEFHLIQELAEVRDVLLQQIEISQAQGLHTKVQHELQSLLNSRDAETASSKSPTSSASATPTRTVASPTIESEANEDDPDKGDIDADAQSEASETSSARERFLEELEDMTQQSSQDLPLEWEFTTPLMAPALMGAGDSEAEGSCNTGSNPPEHRSIWEVFDGRCVRQDCQEVRLKLHRVTQWLLECRARGDEAVPVSDLTLFLEGGFLFGDNEGFFCLAESNVDFVGEGSFESASDKDNVERHSEQETHHENLKSHESIDNLNQISNNSGNPLTLNVQSVQLTEVKNAESQFSGSNDEAENFEMYNKLLAEFELLKKEKLDLENKYEMLQRQLASQSLDKNLEDEFDNLKKLPASPTYSSAQNKSCKDDQSSSELATGVDSGLDLTRSESQKLIQCKDVEIQTDVQENKLVDPPSPSNDRIVHHLQLLLVEKESSLKVLEQEIDKLKSQARSEDGQTDKNRFETVEEQMQTMKSSLEAKDRMITSLQRDLNRLIYPERHNDLLQNNDVQENLSNCRKSNGIENKLDDNDSNAVSLPENETSDLYVTATECSGPQDFTTALSVDVVDESRSGLSIHSSGSNSLVQSSSLFDDASSERSGQGTPFGIDDKDLADELKKLQKDMKETKALYSRENVLLQEALHRDHRAKRNVMIKTKPDLSFRRSASDSSNCPFSTLGSIQDNAYVPSITTEVETVTQRLEICLEQNRMLEIENSTLRAKLREQEATVLQLKVKLEQKEHDTQHWRDSFSSQIRALQSQRNDLMQLIRDLDKGKKGSACETLPDGTMVEEERETNAAAVKLQEDLMERLEELDHLHRMLTQRQVELQHCESERRHLEQLCLLKDLTEMQLMRQKRLMEEQLSELELRLRDRETTLVEEKTKLLAELKNKDACLSGMDRNFGFVEKEANLNISGSLSDSQLLASASTGNPMHSPRESRLLKNTSTPKRSHTPPPTPEEIDRHHLEAIERLRSKLKLEYDIRTARMAESQAAAIASYWERQHSKQT